MTPQITLLANNAAEIKSGVTANVQLQPEEEEEPIQQAQLEEARKQVQKHEVPEEKEEV